MRVFFDNIIYKIQAKGGITTYWNELVKRVNNKILVEAKSQYERYFDLRYIESEKFISHSSYYRITKNPNAIIVNTVHDFTYEYFIKGLGSKLHQWQKKRAVMKSQGVICVSENTARDLRKFYPEYKGKIKVIYHGYSESFRFKNMERKKQCVFVGSRDAYKGFDIAADIVSRLKDFTFVIVGGGPLSSNEKSMLEQKLGQRYKVCGYVSDTELTDIYNTSLCLLYTSNYEGFGIPVLESQACGCPVVCQNVSSIPEVAGNSGIFFDKGNLDKVASDIESLLDTVEISRYQQLGFENIKRFSWDKMAKETINFYQELWDNR